MYEADTFFDLGLTGRIGLVVIAAALGALVLWLDWRLVRRRHWPTRLLGALGVFVVFEWLSPQIFYLWYLTVFDDLPPQSVIGPLPDPVGAVEVLSFQAGVSLSAHARAFLGWALIAVALGAGRFRPPPDHL